MFQIGVIQQRGRDPVGTKGRKSYLLLLLMLLSSSQIMYKILFVY